MLKRFQVQRKPPVVRKMIVEYKHFTTVTVTVTKENKKTEGHAAY